MPTTRLLSPAHKNRHPAKAKAADADIEPGGSSASGECAIAWQRYLEVRGVALGDVRGACAR